MIHPEEKQKHLKQNKVGIAYKSKDVLTSSKCIHLFTYGLTTKIAITNNKKTVKE